MKKLTVPQACAIIHTVGRKAKAIVWWKILLFQNLGLPEMIAWQRMSKEYADSRQSTLAEVNARRGYR